MWKAGHMVEVEWIWMCTYLLVDLEGCSAATFPGVEDIRGGDGAKTLQSFSRQRECGGGSPGILSGVGPGGVCK
jgi:hypothetical protein